MEIFFFEKAVELKNLGIGVANDLFIEERETKRALLKARYLLRKQEDDAQIKGKLKCHTDC